MRRIALLAATLSLLGALAACAGTSSTLHSNGTFSGMSFSMPIGTILK